jgi:hypothetical protein
LHFDHFRGSGEVSQRVFGLSSQCESTHEAVGFSIGSRSEQATSGWKVAL